MGKFSPYIHIGMLVAVKMFSSNEVRLLVDKLEGESDWPKWKWQMNMVLHAYDMEITEAATPPKTSIAPTGEEQALKKWRKDDAEA